MKTFLAAGLLIFSLFTLASAQGKRSSSDAEFKALIDRYFAAWSSLNPDNAAPLYAKDADLVFYDITPLKYAGWAEYEKGSRAGLADFESLKLTPNNDLKVTRRGNIAWTSVTFQLWGRKKTAEKWKPMAGIPSSSPRLHACRYYQQISSE